VDPDDHRALAAALNDLIDNPAERERLADRARRRAAEFSPQRMAAGYQATYSDCLTPRTVEMVT
jgi:glycosyltransferase involved in cell wall biosynthesis